MDTYFENLTKYEKRKMNYKHFINYFSQNIITKKQFKSRHVINNSGKMTEYKNVLLGYQVKTNDSFISEINTNEISTADKDYNFVDITKSVNPLDAGIDSSPSLILNFG